VSNFRVIGINCLQEGDEDMNLNELKEQMSPNKIEEKFISSGWYRYIVSYLLTLKCPNELSPSKTRTLKLHAVKYCIVKSRLYWKDPLVFLLVYLVESETQWVIGEFHEGICGEHHAWRYMAYKILRDGYYWPKRFSDVNAKVQACNPCQLFAGK
jgi:hypothetical protein